MQKERLRLEKLLREEAQARRGLEQELGSKLRQLDIAVTTLGGWKGEVAGLREEMAHSTARVQKQLADHKDSLNAMLDMIEDSVSVAQLPSLVHNVLSDDGQGRGALAGHSASATVLSDVESMGELVESLVGDMEAATAQIEGMARALDGVTEEMGAVETAMVGRLDLLEAGESARKERLNAMVRPSHLLSISTGYTG